MFPHSDAAGRISKNTQLATVLKSCFCKLVLRAIRFNDHHGVSDMENVLIWRPAGVSLPFDGGIAKVVAGGLQLALYEVEGQLYCTDNVCTHAFALLTDGWLEDFLIECPLHAGQFDIRTGCGQGPPIDRNIRTYPVRIFEGQIQIGLPRESN